MPVENLECNNRVCSEAVTDAGAERNAVAAVGKDVARGGFCRDSSGRVYSVGNPPLEGTLKIVKDSV